MQVYKTFFKIAKKYINSVLIYSIIFLILLFLMTKLGGQENEERFVASSVNFSVIDEDKSQASQALIDYLSTKHNLVELDSYSSESLLDHLFYEKIQYVLTIPEGYEDKLLKGDMDHLVEHSMRTDSARGYFFNQDINAYLDTLSIFVGAGYDLDTILTNTEQVATASSEDVVTKISFESASTGDTSLGYYFQYLPYVMMGCLIASITPILIVFHKKDLAARLACSASSVRKQNIGVGLGCVSYCTIYWLIMILLAGITLGFDKLASTLGFYYIANSFIYTLFVIALVLLIGSFNCKIDALNLIANIIALGSSFLCGIFVPQWLLNDKVLAVSRFLPAYWYVKSNNMLAGFTGEAINSKVFWTNFGMQALFVVAIISIYLVVSTQRRAKSLA